MLVELQQAFNNKKVAVNPQKVKYVEEKDENLCYVEVEDGPHYLVSNPYNEILQKVANHISHEGEIYEEQDQS